MPGARATSRRRRAALAGAGALALLLVAAWFVAGRSGADASAPSRASADAAPRSPGTPRPREQPPRRSGAGSGGVEAVPRDGPAASPAEASPPPRAPWRLHGAVRSADGLPIPGAAVALDSRSVLPFDAAGRALDPALLESLRSDPPRAVADEEGSWSLEIPLPAGVLGQALAVEGTAEGFRAGRASVALAEEAVSRPLAITLARATEIAGRVVERGGAPVAGARVLAWSDVPGEAALSAATGEDGAFRLVGTPAGEFLLTVAPPAMDGVAWLEEGLSRRVRGGDRGVEFVLERRAAPRAERARLVARFVDPATGATVTPLRATLDSTDRPYREVPRGSVVPAAVAADGSVSGEAAAGRWRVWVLLPGGIVRTAEFDVAEGQSAAAATVEVRPGGRIEGTLDLSALPAVRRDPPSVTAELAGGGSFPNWTLFDEARNASWPETITASLPLAADGSFRSGVLVPGRWRLEVLTDRIAVRGEADVPADGTARVALVAGRSGALRIRIAVPEGGGWYRLETWPDGGFRRPGTDRRVEGPDPVESLRPVHPGPVRWRVQWRAARAPEDPRAPAAREAEGLADVRPGETVELDVPVPGAR